MVDIVKTFWSALNCICLLLHDYTNGTTYKIFFVTQITVLTNTVNVVMDLYQLGMSESKLQKTWRETVILNSCL